MKAVQFQQFGPPQVLSLTEVPIPEAGEGEVRLRVHAVSVNAVDVYQRQGRMRLLMGSHFPQGTGLDVVGTVDAVGRGVSSTMLGSRVWAVRAEGRARALGTAAEYVCIASRLVVPAPSGVTDSIAAAALTGTVTAVRALDHSVRLRAGERVLVRGAAGGVGVHVVQVAKARGAHVTALAGAAQLDALLSLGADEALDYRSSIPEDLHRPDVIVDTVGTELPKWRRLLAPEGRIVSVAFNSAPTLAAVFVSLLAGPRRIRTFVGQPPNGALEEASRLLGAGQISSVPALVFSISDASAAHEAFQRGSLLGRIVLNV